MPSGGRGLFQTGLEQALSGGFCFFVWFLIVGVLGGRGVKVLLTAGPDITHTLWVLGDVTARIATPLLTPLPPRLVGICIPRRSGAP